MLQDIIKQLTVVQKEMEDLKYQKLQLEALIAVVMAEVGELTIQAPDLFKVDYQKVKLITKEEDKLTVKIIYEKNNKAK